MSQSRKKFGCGHRGFGRWCHRCAQANDLMKIADSLPELGAAKKFGKKETALVRFPDELHELVHRYVDKNYSFESEYGYGLIPKAKATSLRLELRDALMDEVLRLRHASSAVAA